MQQFYEKQDGTRMPINSTQAMICENDANTMRLVCTPMLVVYRSRQRPVASPNYRYGGRGNHKSPNGWRGN